ncbi:hypothetical protein ACFZAV_41615 [Streptomyces sp. NPDC008343]
MRFNEAVRSLCSVAGEHRARMAERLAAETPEIPDQRRSFTPQRPAHPA